MNPRDEISRIRSLHGEAQKNALIAFVDQLTAAQEEIISKTIFVLRFRTLDGAEKMLNWRGRPPEVFNLPMRSTKNEASYFSQPADIHFEPQRTRSYRLVDFRVRQGTAEYEEIGP